ncbi:MDR family MFS transporter [uncultured Deinococcus sp.]|uniref:MDR family MFS transporter n=1 Tax=uncultured Deinococcus sp. TaxID=158789 RepID=UPI00258C0EBE|nr:MDR family MFS transporter [uncultured Deinococcus sp.]
MTQTSPPATTGQHINYAETLDLRTKQLIVAGVLLGLFLSALDQTIVSTALPRIARELDGLSLYSWVTTAYLLTSSAMVPIYGKLSDLYGRKPILMIGIFIFLLGSALCGLSGEPFLGNLFGGGMMQLVVFRGVQGIGAAALASVAFAIVADIFAPRDRAKYQGLFGAVFGLSSVIGPLLGGFLTDSLSWRWVFYVNLPLGLIALAFIFAKMPRLASGLKAKVDYLGAALIIVFTVPLLLALTWGADGNYAWGSPQLLSLFALSAAALVAFLFAESRHPSPIVPLGLFRNRTFTWVMISRFLVGAGFLGAILFLTLFLVNVRGFSATGAGTATIPLTIGFIIGAQSAGLLAARLGRYKWLIVGALSLATVAFIWLSTITADTSYPMLAARMVLVGLGLGPTVSLFTLAAQSAVSRQEIGVATSSGTFFQQMGGTIGVALFGAVLTSALGTQFKTNFAEVVRNAPPQLQSQLATVQNGSGGAQGGQAFDAEAAKQKAEAGIKAGFAQQYQTIEAAVRSGDPAQFAALKQNAQLPEALRSGLAGVPDQAVQSPAGQTQVLTRVRQSFDAAQTEVLAQTDRSLDGVSRAIKVSFANSVARIYAVGIFVIALALIAALFIPDRRLGGRDPQAAPVMDAH